QGGMNSLPEIGKQLGVEHLIALDPRGPDDAPRVEIRLIEVPTQKVAWAASYMLDTTRFAEIEEDVVSRVSHSFLGRQSREPSLVPARRGGESARLAYLAGQRALRRRTPEGVSESIRFFEEAVKLDSSSAAAVGGLAQALALQLSYGYRTSEPNYATAARALGRADRAVRLDPTRGDPVSFRAFIEYLAFAPNGVVRDDF